MPIAYTPDALIYDAGTNTWTLRPDYDPALHRVDIQITDDDAYLDGDLGADEVGIDTNQTAEVRDMDGNLITSGQIYDEEFYSVWDGVNPHIFIENVEIAGVQVGYIVSEPLQPGTAYTMSSQNDVGAPPQAATYGSFSDVPCFGAGTLIATARGNVPVQWPTPGDRIMTRDAGLQPLRWLGRYTLSAAQLTAEPHLRPVRVNPGQFGLGRPARPLFVSPQHRLLLTGASLELYFAESEALCAAKFLLPQTMPALPNGHFTYYHVLFDHHHVVLANGLWSESLFAGTQVCDIAVASGTTPPADIRHDRTARLCLTRSEASLLVAARKTGLRATA